MSEPLTAEEIEDIRRIHVEDTSGECCAADENYWPCDSARLLATLAAARDPPGLDGGWNLAHGLAIVVLSNEVSDGLREHAEEVERQYWRVQQREGAGE